MTQKFRFVLGRAENIVGKGENICISTFSPFPTMFSKAFTDHNREVLVGPSPKQVLVFMCQQFKSFENTVGKGEIARNQQFLLFLHYFLTFLEKSVSFSSNLKLLSAKSFSLEEPKICDLGKG